MSPSICLNLGSGQRPFAKPWINVDIQAKHGPDVVSSAELYLQGQMNDSVDMICLHHVLEHMTLEESKSILTACQRVLAPRGSLLVFVPDLEALSHAWIEGRIDDYIFCVNLHGAYMGEVEDIHKWSYTSRSLVKHIIPCAPWCRVIPFNWRVIPGADIARDWWVLGLEVIK